MFVDIARKINDLNSLVEEGLKLLKGLDDDFITANSVAYSDVELFRIVSSEVNTLDSILSLARFGKFKDCMILLRSIFENMLYFRLMAEGKTYRLWRMYPIIPNPGNTNPAARDSTLAKWQTEWKQGKHNDKEIISIDPVGQDRIQVVHEHEGLYETKDTEKKGPILPWYWVVMDDYSPDVKFLSDLPSIKAGDLYPDITAQHKLEQDQLYHHYIYIEAIVKNLLLNELVTETQTEYIFVHYNYLSSFLHPSKRAFSSSSYFQQHQNSDGDYVTWQILLYVCQIQLSFFRSIVNKVKRDDSKANTKKYEDYISKIDSATSYFWFIDNGPTQQDIDESNQKKIWVDEKRKGDPTVVYYVDPIERLIKFGSVFLRNNR